MRLLVYLLIVLFITACRPEREAEPVLARVGDRVITAETFQLNYAFGHAHLRRHDNPKETYLGFMVNELLLAQEGEKRELDTLTAIQYALQTLEEELLIEEVFNTEILDQIQVSPEEIREEINRSAVKFQFRVLPALSEEDALRARSRIVAIGYDSTMAERAIANPELAATPGEWDSPYVAADDIDPVLLGYLQDIPLRTPSEPVFYNDEWYILEVADVTRVPVAEEDYEQRAPSAEKVLYNKKAMQQGTQFIYDLMTPLDVRTHRAGFENVHRVLWDWYNSAPPVRPLAQYEQGSEGEFLRQLMVHATDSLVSFGGQTWTVSDFVNHFTPGRYSLPVKQENAFKARLADVVALVVRDEHLLRMAEENKLSRNERYQKQRALWKDKWLFLETRKWLQQHQGSWQEFLDSLQNRVDVEINTAMLDTLQLDASVVNPYQTVHLMKSNSNKMPFPIADPNWKP